jgi:aspartate/methionine/tyrosine aminotransferase
MHLPPFLLDHWLAAHEFATPPIRYNFASSAGPPWTLGELMALGGESGSAFDALRLSYAPPQGCRELRDLIARFYDVDSDWVLTTTGASEALSSVMCLAAEPGATILLPFPMFPAFASVAQAWGFHVETYSLDRRDGFIQTAERILSKVTDKTKLVLVNTPHNPTGAVMSATDIQRLAAALAEREIPLLVDEVYHPLYFGTPTSSAVKIPNTIVVGDCSKAFSLPGLRIGWVIDRDAARRERLIDIRSYLTISGSPLTEAVAVHALRHIDRILKRVDDAAQNNLKALDQFMRLHSDRFGWVTPQGGTVAFPWRLDGQTSRPMCEQLARAGVLFAPGDCFSMPEHFRIGFGARTSGITEALEIMSSLIRSAKSI